MESMGVVDLHAPRGIQGRLGQSSKCQAFLTMEFEASKYAGNKGGLQKATVDLRSRTAGWREMAR